MLNMREISSKAKRKELANSSGKMAVRLLANLGMTLLMERVNTPGLMADYLRATGGMEKWRDEDYLFGRMQGNI